MLRDRILDWLDTPDYLREHGTGWRLLRDTETVNPRHLFALEKDNAYNLTVISLRLEEALEDLPDPQAVPAAIRVRNRTTPDEVKEEYKKWSELRIRRGVEHDKLFSAETDKERHEIARRVLAIGEEITRTWRYIQVWKDFGMPPSRLKVEEVNAGRFRSLQTLIPRRRRMLKKAEEAGLGDKVKLYTTQLDELIAEQAALEKMRYKWD